MALELKLYFCSYHWLSIFITVLFLINFKSTFGFYISDCGTLYVLIQFLFLHERVRNFVNKDTYTLC